MKRHKVLIADDDPRARDGLISLLATVPEIEIVGEATNGREAIQLYQEARNRQEPIDIVILDLTVPGGMGGEETMRELHRLDSGVTGIATSGYCNNPVMADYLDYGFKGVLPKPCRLEVMTQLIEELLVK